MMKILIVSVCTFGLLVLNSCRQNEEWQDLFNGNDLDGWEINGGEDSNFFVEDGMIVAETKMGIPNTFLVTSKKYSDFELEVEFRVDRGMNTGIQIRSSVYARDTVTAYLSGRLETEIREWPAGTVHGYQIEIDPSDRAWTGGFYEEGGRGWLVPLTENENARIAFKQEEWNHFRIIAEGNRFQTWINGVQAVDTTDDDASSGFIGLQLHSIGNKEQEGRRTLWKNLRIHELN